MAWADPDTFEFFRRGEPSESLFGNESTGLFGMFRRSEPPASLLVGPAGPSASFTIINGTQSQLVNVNAGGTDVDAMTYKTTVTLTQIEVAALAYTPGVMVTADATPVTQLRRIIKNIVRFVSP